MALYLNTVDIHCHCLFWKGQWTFTMSFRFMIDSGHPLCEWILRLAVDIHYQDNFEVDGGYLLPASNLWLTVDIHCCCSFWSTWWTFTDSFKFVNDGGHPLCNKVTSGYLLPGRKLWLMVDIHLHGSVSCNSGYLLALWILWSGGNPPWADFKVTSGYPLSFLLLNQTLDMHC